MDAGYRADSLCKSRAEQSMNIGKPPLQVGLFRQAMICDHIACSITTSGAYWKRTGIDGHWLVFQTISERGFGGNCCKYCVWNIDQYDIERAFGGKTQTLAATLVPQAPP